MYPGSVDTHIIRLNAAGKKKNPKFVSIDKREWLTYLGLFYGASLLKQKGRDLWRVPEEGDSIFSPSPNYNKYMSRTDLRLLKALWLLYSLMNKIEKILGIKLELELTSLTHRD